MEIGNFAFDDKYPEARESLRNAVNSLDYLEYAVHEGPLQISQLPGSTRTKPEIQQVIAKHGWPNLREDSLIEPVQTFDTDKEFIDSLRPIDEYGTQKLISSYFFSMLLVAPHNRADSPYVTAPIVGEMPVVHRAYAIAPDLFESLRVVLEEFKKRYRDIQPVDDEDRIYEAIMNEENAEIPQAMHMAYRILGRLLKSTDAEVLHEKFNRDRPSAPILNADAALRHGEM